MPLDIRIFVYGTLKRGFSNYYKYLSDAIYEGESELTGYIMRAIYSIPIVHPTTEQVYSIYTERFLINNDILTALDILESVPTMYRRVSIQDQEGREGFMYISPQDTLTGKSFETFIKRHSSQIITNGRWEGRK